MSASDGNVSGSDAGEAAAAMRAAAAVHDLGYKRYLGTRRPQNTRWRVIARRDLSIAWRGWKRLKIWVVLAAMGVVAVCAIMYFLRESNFEEALMHGASVSFSDMLVPFSLDIFNKVAFIVTVVVVAPAVARDLRSSAFVFYFSRPVRPIDYLLGKIGGAMLVLAPVMLLPPVAVALFRVGLTRDLDTLGPTLAMVPKTALVGGLATAMYALVPLAFSALTNRPTHAVVYWAAWHLVVGSTAVGMATLSGQPTVAVLDIPAALFGVTAALFDVSLSGRPVPPFGAAVAALATYAVAAVVVLFWRVRAVHGAGIGGA